MMGTYIIEDAYNRIKKIYLDRQRKGVRKMIQLEGELRVGVFDTETDSFPVLQWINNYCYGTVAEFGSLDLAEEWVKWKNERAT